MPASLAIPNNTGNNVEQDVELNELRALSRSPHPYHRTRSELQDVNPSKRLKGDDNYLPSPSPTPSPYNTSDESRNADHDLARRKLARSLSDSGTEADDEGFALLKGLPAPPLRPKKGLRGSRTPIFGTTPSPLITPAYLSDAGRRFSVEFGAARRLTEGAEGKASAEVQRKLEAYSRRRTAELRRRSFETLLMLSIGAVSLKARGVLPALRAGHQGTGTGPPPSSRSTCPLTDNRHS
jgi:hypothetical protein